MSPYQLRAAREWLRERYPCAEIREDWWGLLVVGAEDRPCVRLHERHRHIDLDYGGFSLTVPVEDDVIEALERAHAAYDAYSLWSPPSSQGRAAKVPPRGGR